MLILIEVIVKIQIIQQTQTYIQNRTQKKVGIRLNINKCKKIYKIIVIIMITISLMI